MPETYISLGDSLILAVVGFCVVLVALGALALFIMAMAKIINSKKAAPAAPAVSAPAAPVTPAVNPNMVALPETTSMGSCDLHDVSDRDAAMIMAIVADKLNAPLNTLVFKSIKEVK